VEVTRIPIKYGRLKWLLALCGVPPRSAYLERTGDDIDVRMGWAFRTRIRRGDIVGTNRYGRSISIGVHGWRGRWLVNGASEPIVGLELREPVPGYVLGFRVKLQELIVSVDDPDALLRLVGVA
jgi:hypothetical protein